MNNQKRAVLEKIIKNIQNEVNEQKKVVEENEEYFLDDFDYDMKETFKYVDRCCDAMLIILKGY